MEKVINCEHKSSNVDTTNLSRIRHNVLSRGINPQPLGFGGVFAVFKISIQFL